MFAKQQMKMLLLYILLIVMALCQS